ncbi:MAG: hypothetical protein JWO06_2612 [Bacteroidota bacterium]|nr:hypothetical protein [Bacteroidota bacterium]
MKKHRKGGDGSDSSQSRKGTLNTDSKKRSSNSSMEEGKTSKSGQGSQEKGRGSQSERTHDEETDRS